MMTQDVESHHLQLLLSYMYRGQVKIIIIVVVIVASIFTGVIYCDFAIIVIAFL